MPNSLSHGRVVPRAWQLLGCAGTPGGGYLRATSAVSLFLAARLCCPTKEKKGSGQEQLPSLLFLLGLRLPVPTLEANMLEPATLRPAGCHLSPTQLRAAAQGGIRLLQGEGHVLAELIGLLALFPALRHQLSILQQKIKGS